MPGESFGPWIGIKRRVEQTPENIEAMIREGIVVYCD